MDEKSIAPETPQKKKGMPLTAKLKLAGGGILIALIAIVILQNTKSITTKILFMEMKMPLAALIFITFLLGVGLGVLLAFMRPWRDKK